MHIPRILIINEYTLAFDRLCKSQIKVQISTPYCSRQVSIRHVIKHVVKGQIIVFITLARNAATLLLLLLMMLQ